MRSWVSMLALAVACGGAPKNANDARRADDPNKETRDAISANGCIPSLGGCDTPSGEGGPVPEMFKLDLLDKTRPVKFDGVLQEWPARFAVKEAKKGDAGGRVAFAISVQYDDAKIYVGGEVTDDKFVRTSSFGDGEDHASIILAFPNGAGGYAPYEIGLYAGKPGESSGSVRTKRGEIPGSKIVEAPIDKGYSFEASFPWAAIPEARHVRVGLRGVARYYSADSPGDVSTILATADGDASSPESMPFVPTESEQSVLEKLGTTALKTPKFFAVADVANDAMKERVAVFDRFLTICGPSYLGGDKFFFKDLGGELVSLELRGVTGRGKDDLLLRRRFNSQGGTKREWFEVLSVLADTEPQTTFAHEIAVASNANKISNAVHVGAKEIEVTFEPATGWDASTYHEPIASEVDPVLLPWGPVRSQTYRFNGKLFAKSGESKSDSAQSTSSAMPANDGARPPPAPPTPEVKPGTDLSKQVFEQYKRDRGVAAEARAKFDIEVQVAGDARPERVVLINRDIVVFGPGFKGGTQYAYITLSQFADPADIKELTARDLTGDGNADLVVRGVRRVTVAGSSDPVVLDVMFVYEVKSDSVVRIFGIETGREQAGKRVQGLVQFIPSRTRGFEVDVRPGRATGWTDKTYPWQQEQPGGAIEPLLLPWGGIASLRYAYNGTAFAKL